MANPIPEKLINFRVYLEGGNLVGVAEVELPKLASLSESVMGAGIAGEVESPIPGHYGPMSATIKFRTVYKDVGVLAKPGAHLVDFRGSLQVSEGGTLKNVPLRVTLKATPKSVGLGALKVGAAMDAEDEFSVSYIKVYVDGAEKIEIDIYNSIARFDGVDVLEGVRADLGV